MPADPTVDFDDVVDEGVESRDGNSRQKVVTLPLTTDNVFALLVILLLAVIGDGPLCVNFLTRVLHHRLRVLIQTDHSEGMHVPLVQRHI